MWQATARTLARGAWLGVLALLAAAAVADDELDYGLQRQPLARIELAGNVTYSDGEIKEILTIQEPNWRHPLAVPRYRPDLIESQLRLIESFYRRGGFHQVSVVLDSVRTLPERGDVLHITVHEGPRTGIDQIDIVGAGPLSVADIRPQLTLTEGDPAPADLNDLGPDIFNIQRLYWDNAYLDVLVEPAMSITSTADPERFLARLEYRITPGTRYTIGQIVIRGNEHTRTSLIARELQVEPGGPFAWNAVEESRRRLRQTALFRDVSFIPANLDSVAGLGDLVVQVVERKPAYFEFGAGVGSRERVRLSGAWGNNNLWRSGRRLNVRGKVYLNVEEILGQNRDWRDGDLNYRLEARYEHPHLLASDYTADLGTYLKRETRGESGLILNTIAVAVGLERWFGPRWDHRLSLEFKENRPRVHPDAGADLAERFARANVTDTQTRSLIYAALHDRRDDPFRPQRGLLAAAHWQLAGGLFGGDNSFLKWWGALHEYVRSPLGGTLALRLRLGVVGPYGQSGGRGADGIPYEDRFFAGGGTTVRGYRENSLGPQIQDQKELDELEFRSDVPLPDSPARGGSYQLLTNLEWRFPLPLLSHWNFAGVLFFDGGNVWGQLSEIRLKGFRLRSTPGAPEDPASTKLWDYRYSVGTGLRLNTPFGPFRIDVGFPLKRARYVSVDQDFTDEKVLYHFSLGYPF